MFLLPSFFRLIRELRARKYDFKIVFRTFGSDLAEVSSNQLMYSPSIKYDILYCMVLQVAEELNLFCSGAHPLYPPLEDDAGALVGAEYRMSLPEDSLKMIRTGPGPGTQSEEDMAWPLLLRSSFSLPLSLPPRRRAHCVRGREWLPRLSHWRL